MILSAGVHNFMRDRKHLNPNLNHSVLCFVSTRKSLTPLQPSKSPDFIDATRSGFTYDSLAGLDYFQYPHTDAFGVPSSLCPS